MKMTGKSAVVLIRSLLNHLELNPYGDIMYPEYRKALIIVLKTADKISDMLDVRNRWYNGLRNKALTVIQGERPEENAFLEGDVKEEGVC